MLNLIRIAKLQKELDDLVAKNHNIDWKEVFGKKCVALAVELGEFLNESCYFKYWSTNQKPRTFVALFHGWDTKEWKDENGETHVKAINPLLEEYADVLHFTISIGLDLGFTGEALQNHFEENKDILGMEDEEMNDAVTLTYSLVSVINFITNAVMKKYIYLDLLESVLTIGKYYFTWEEIEEAYADKNEINRQRQANNY